MRYPLLTYIRTGTFQITRDIPPIAIDDGSPARVLRFREGKTVDETKEAVS